MQHLEVSGAVRHIYIYIYICVIRQLKVKVTTARAEVSWLVSLCVCVPHTSSTVLFQFYSKHCYSTLGITDHATEERDLQRSHDSNRPLFELRI